MKVSEIKVSYINQSDKKVIIDNSKRVYDVAIAHWDLDIIEYQEEVKVILLNRANIVLGIYDLSKGGTASSVVDLKIILSVALKSHSSIIVLVHNHPSGKLVPSTADIRLTERLKKACKGLDLVLLDHLIINRDTFYSFSDEGTL